MAITILHLTDLHAGRHAIEDIDKKEVISGVEREKLLDRLTHYLENLPKVPDYVAVTGDLTIAGDREGFDQAKSWFRERIKAGHLPAADRILITPGNHDVRWGVAEGEPLLCLQLFARLWRLSESRSFHCGVAGGADQDF